MEWLIEGNNLLMRRHPNGGADFLGISFSFVEEEGTEYLVIEHDNEDFPVEFTAGKDGPIVRLKTKISE